MTKPSRATNVQTPGEQPTAAPAQAPAPAPDQQQTSAPVAQAPASEAGQPDTTAQVGATPVVDIEALRAQIREEEQTRARAELASQFEIASKAASTVLASPASAPAASIQRSRTDYLGMRADDVDPGTLTAPVLTKDGWVCPLPPEPKK